MNNRRKEREREMVMLVAVLMECAAKKKPEKFSTLLKTRYELKHSVKTFSPAKHMSGSIGVHVCFVNVGLSHSHRY